MRVIGIDPGSRRCGWGVVEAREGSRLGWVAHGVVQPPAHDPLESRLVAVYEGLVRVIAEHAPDACGVEDVFFAASARSALVLGQARGVALLAAARAGLRVFAYPPAMVKQAVTGSGRAEKFQVARMVGVILGVPEAGQADAADALAIAITHATRGGATAVPAAARGAR